MRHLVIDPEISLIAVEVVSALEGIVVAEGQVSGRQWIILRVRKQSCCKRALRKRRVRLEVVRNGSITVILIHKLSGWITANPADESGPGTVYTGGNCRNPT